MSNSGPAASENASFYIIHGPTFLDLVNAKRYRGKDLTIEDLEEVILEHKINYNAPDSAKDENVNLPVRPKLSQSKYLAPNYYKKYKGCGKSSCINEKQDTCLKLYPKDVSQHCVGCLRPEAKAKCLRNVCLTENPNFVKEEEKADIERKLIFNKYKIEADSYLDKLKFFHENAKGGKESLKTVLNTYVNSTPTQTPPPIQDDKIGQNNLTFSLNSVGMYSYVDAVLNSLYQGFINRTVFDNNPVYPEVLIEGYTTLSEEEKLKKLKERKAQIDNDFPSVKGKVRNSYENIDNQKTHIQRSADNLNAAFISLSHIYDATVGHCREDNDLAVTSTSLDNEIEVVSESLKDKNAISFASLSAAVVEKIGTKRASKNALEENSGKSLAELRSSIIEKLRGKEEDRKQKKINEGKRLFTIHKEQFGFTEMPEEFGEEEAEMFIEWDKKFQALGSKGRT